MKKLKILLSISLLLLILFSFILIKNNNVNDIFENKNKVDKSVNKSISMNLEQTAGTGDYKTVSRSNWPTKGYKFNEELSRCENGSILSWDDTKKVVVLSGNSLDKCYVYFDKIVYKIKAKVNKVRPDSFIVNVEMENDEIDTSVYNKYYFSVDGGNSFVSSSSTSYKFSNLAENSTFSVVVYAEDSDGSISNYYFFSVTNDYYSDAIFALTDTFDFDGSEFNPTFELDNKILTFTNIKLGGNCVLDFMGMALRNVVNDVEINAINQTDINDNLELKSGNFYNLYNMTLSIKATEGNIILDNISLESLQDVVLEFQLSENGSLIISYLFVKNSDAIFKITGNSKYIGENVQSIDDLPSVTKEFFNNMLNTSEFGGENNITFVIGDFSVSIEDLLDYNW